MKQIKLFIILGIIFITGSIEVISQCVAQGSFLNESYNPADWGLVQDQLDGTGGTGAATNCGTNLNGTISIIPGVGGGCRFSTVRGARNLRIGRSFPNSASLSNINWTADFNFTFIAPPVAGATVTNAPGVILAAFTNGGAPVRNSCTGGNICTSCGVANYSLGPSDAVWLTLASPNPFNNCTVDQTQDPNWNFTLHVKNGGNSPTSSIPIPLNGQNTYYIRIQRTTANWFMIGVYTSATYATHIPGSPQCVFVDQQISPITSLNYLQHGVEPQGNCGRIANIRIAGMKIDDALTCPSTLTPSFNTVNLGCDNLTFNGSPTSGNPLQEDANFWEITPCDQFGNVAQNAPSWNQWVAGTAGLFTFPSIANGGPNFITCGNYYRVKLAVTNCLVQWSETTQVVYVACPTLYAGPDVVNCNPIFQSAPFGLSSNPGSPWSYVWTSSNPNITVGNSGGPTGGINGEGSATITMTATYQPGCTATDQLEYAGIIADAGPDRMICTKSAPGPINSVEIGANSSEGMSYLWQGPTGSIIDCPTCPKTLAKLTNPNATGIFTLTVTAPSGLFCTDQVTITTNPNLHGFWSTVLPSPLNVDCDLIFGNFSLVATFTGAVSPYTYLWNSITSPAVNNLNSTTTSTVTFVNCNSGSNPAYFFVTVTDANGCQASRVATVNYLNGPMDPRGTTNNDPTTTNNTGTSSDINESSLKFNVELAPNPNTGTFNLFIQSPLNSSPFIHLIDLSGRILYSQTISLQEGYNQIEISKPELPSGVYFVHVDGFPETIKMIVTQ